MTLLSTLTGASGSPSEFAWHKTDRLRKIRSASNARLNSITGQTQRLRVGITTSVIQRGKTGVAQYVFALVRALIEEGEQHDFTLFVLEEDLPLFAFAADRMTIVSVKEKWRPAVRNILWHQVQLPRLAKSLKLDVLHVPSYRRMLWRRPCATVATIHDLAPFHVKGKYDLARMIYGRVAARQLARRQDKVVSISSNTARDIERFFGLPMSRQTVVLNGLDHERFHPGDSALARADATSQWKLDAPYFLYISRLEHPAKNHVRLIEAFNRFKASSGSRWLLALGGSDWHGAEVIHQMAAQSPYAKDIRFLGFVSDQALPNLYRAAGAFVYPSLFEGFGMPPGEAMACGCPVISSTRGALAEVVGQAAVHINPDDVESITQALLRVALQPALRQTLRQIGFANAARFDWGANARQVIQVYEAAAQCRSAAS